MPRRPLAALLATALLLSLAGCCAGGSCIKDPPCKPACGCSAPAK